MSDKEVGIGSVALALSIICIVLIGSLIVVIANYGGIIRNRDSEIKTFTDKTAQLQSWLDGNVSILNTLMNITQNVNVTNWPQQPEPSWRVEFYKGFQMSWPQLFYSVQTPEWELHCGGYGKAIIYMRLTNISSSLQGSRTTIYLNYIEWYGSTQGGNDFLGSTILSENALNVTMPGSVDPQNGPLEVVTKGPYFSFQFAVDSTYNVSASATFDMSVYFRN
jgi:hypothetical protein